MNNWNGIVSLFFACFELVLAVNILIFAPKNKTNKLAALIVFILMIYQLLEFILCRLGTNNSLLTYLAFADITFLPPLNLYFYLKYFKLYKKELSLIFIPAIFFITYYAFIISHFEVLKCTSLYASYNYPLGWLYGIFYYSPLLISMIVIAKNVINHKDFKNKKLITVLLGGLVFISLPVIFAFILRFFNQDLLINIIESIMCKFAVVYAVCLAYFSFK